MRYMMYIYYIWHRVDDRGIQDTLYTYVNTWYMYILNNFVSVLKYVPSF